MLIKVFFFFFYHCTLRIIARFGFLRKELSDVFIFQALTILKICPKKLLFLDLKVSHPTHMACFLINHLLFKGLKRNTLKIPTFKWTPILFNLCSDHQGLLASYNFSLSSSKIVVIVVEKEMLMVKGQVEERGKIGSRDVHFIKISVSREISCSISILVIF